MRISALLCMLGLAVVSAGQIELTVDFPLESLRAVGSEGYSRLSMPECVPWGSPGEPLLPVRPVTLVIPPGAREVGFEVVGGREVELARLSPAPVRRPRPFSDGDPLPDRVEGPIYSGSGPWPQEPTRRTHVGRMSGYTLASAVLSPLRWDPATESLSGYRELTLRVTWEGTEPVRSGQRNRRLAASRLSGWVDNPQDLSAFAPAAGAESLDYLVITSEDYADSFAELVDYKSATGISAELVHIEDILVGSSGWDDAEKLRNYIIDRYNDDGISYVLLGGDGSVVPTRSIYLECEGYSDNAPCDLYFSDLDGSWDASGDHQYGQPDDDLDLYSDVAVGRALFDEASEAALFVERSIMYDQNPPAGDWRSTAMLCGAGLFTGYTGAKVCDSIAAYLPADWDVNKAYESTGLADGFDTHIDIIEAGTNWNHYAGHGNTSGIYWQGYPSAMMTNSVAQGLTNGDMAGIHHSIGCHPGAFHDGECCAEALWHNGAGGASSVMFNSSYGWEGYLPAMGVSEWMCVYITEEVFSLGNSRIGPAFATSKDRRVPLWSGGHDRELYCIMDWNAYHDPTLTVLQGTSPTAPPAAVPSGCPAVSLQGPWPNPARAGGSVTLSASFSAAGASLEVWDICGRLRRRQTLDGPGQVNLALAGHGRPLPAGVYLVRLSAAGGSAVRRMTVID